MEQGYGGLILLYVDSRTGSKEFINAFTPWSIPVELIELEFADFMFVGNGPDGDRTIGIERKELHDMLTSMRDGRFSGHQLGGLLETYHRVVLIVEGVWRSGRDGILEELHGRQWVPVRGQFMYRELTAFLSTMTEICGVRVERTQDKYETAVCIATIYKWYTEKKWSEHSGHKIMHNRALVANRNGRAIRIMKPSLLRRVVSQLDSVAGTKSALIAGDEEEQIAGQFDSVYEMALAEPCDWRNIRGIGRKTSQDIVRALRNLPKDAVVEAEPVKRARKVKGATGEAKS